jgi:hypothetical protein
MRNKDHLMLEEAYTQIYKEKCENVNEPKEKNETVGRLKNLRLSNLNQINFILLVFIFFKLKNGLLK